MPDSLSTYERAWRDFQHCHRRTLCEGGIDCYGRLRVLACTKKVAWRRIEPRCQHSPAVPQVAVQSLVQRPRPRTNFGERKRAICKELGAVGGLDVQVRRPRKLGCACVQLHGLRKAPTPEGIIGGLVPVIPAPCRHRGRHRSAWLCLPELGLV